MVTGPEHLGLILEDIPFCLDLTCSLYTTMSPTLKYLSWAALYRQATCFRALSLEWPASKTSRVLRSLLPHHVVNLTPPQECATTTAEIAWRD